VTRMDDVERLSRILAGQSDEDPGEQGGDDS
jgi:hypothetical protein